MMGLPMENNPRGNRALQGMDNKDAFGNRDYNRVSQDRNDPTGKLESGRERWVKLSPKRQDYLAFEKERIQLKVRFDLLEFKMEQETEE